MEKLNFVKKGVIRLPPGFRFHPTDEELVVQYLKRKVYSYPLPASIIPELNVCKYDPWDLPGNSEDQYYFNTREAMQPYGNCRQNRATSSGYWRTSTTRSDKKVLAFRNTLVVGMKKTLVFYRGKRSKETKTNWIMHEYGLVNPAATSTCNLINRKNSTQSSMIQIGDWVICKIFLKRSSKKGEEMGKSRNEKRVSNNLRVLQRPRYMGSISSLSTSSASSGITEVSSCTASDHEETSPYNIELSSSSCARET